MFTFNGIDFSNCGVEIKVTAGGLKRPLMAPLRISTTTVEGKAGNIFNRAVPDGYSIDVDVYVISQDMRNDLRKFGGFLYAEAPAPLIFHDETDKYINAIVKDASSFERDAVNRYKGTVSFQCDDPYYYAVNDDIFTFTGTGAHSFSRQGNVESYPIVEIQGTSGQYTINDNNGNIMTFNGTINAGEKLIIDSKLLTAYILASDGVTKTSAVSSFDKLDFPVLKAGDNTFTITTANGASLTQMKITCNSRWI